MNEISAKLLNAELQLTQMKNTAEQLRGRAEEAAALSQKLADVRHAHLFTIHNFLQCFAYRTSSYFEILERKTSKELNKLRALDPHSFFADPVRTHLFFFSFQIWIQLLSQFGS